MLNRKWWMKRGESVHNLSRSTGISSGLCTGIARSVSGGVHSVGRFSGFSARVWHRLPTGSSGTSVSVAGRVFPTVHSTYKDNDFFTFKFITVVKEVI